MTFQANCGTTAMGIMPHRDIGRALKLTLGLDIPFWPQLPQISFFEDMYVQFSQHFPGIIVDEENKKLKFDSARFQAELTDYSQKMADPNTFALTDEYSVVYKRFLGKDLSKFAAIRGQSIGPVSFGFRVVDEDNRPIIYNDDVRILLYDFIKNKINAQYRELRAKNANAFVWLDEPGLGWVFSGMSGYNDNLAKEDYQSFMEGVEGIRALHLCANVNLPYLLGMGTELLSFDAYQMQQLPQGYADSVAKFIRKGGIICWGIVPTDSDTLTKETPETMTAMLSEFWNVVAANTGLSAAVIAERSLIAPARCCLKNVGQVGSSTDVVSAGQAEDGHSGEHSGNHSMEETLVETAFGYLRDISAALRNRYELPPCGQGVDLER